jgi:hypothetical protein
MSKISNLNSNGTSTPFNAATEKISTPMDAVFQRLQPREVEQFYKSYHFWLLQRRIETFYTEARAVQQAILDNTTLMQQIPLSAIALASLAQLQASGVSDLDLLDRMLERGETWLDHTMQLLEHCEKLDVIQGDYTQWCEHALEGAYDWIASMDATETIEEINQPENDVISNEQQPQLHSATEEQLLQKLMSDEGATEKIAPLNSLFNEASERTLEAPIRKITQPLDPSELTIIETPIRKITQPLDLSEPATLEATLPTRKITQPLDQGERLIETELPAETAVPTATEQIEQAARDESILQSETPLSSENDAEQTGAMPALVIEQISETYSEANAERSLEPDTSNQIIEEPRIERSALIDAMQPAAEELQVNTMQEVTTIETEDAFKETDIHPVEETIVNKEVPVQTSTEVVVISESLQQNKKPQLQKVPRRGFWRLLHRLLTIILRR